MYEISDFIYWIYYCGMWIFVVLSLFAYHLVDTPIRVAIWNPSRLARKLRVVAVTSLNWFIAKV